MPRKAFRLTDVQRQTRYGVVADGLDELKRKGSTKFPSSHDPADVFLVLDSDGTIVDNDEYLMLLPDHTLVMLLKPGEIWQAAPSDNVALPRDEVDGDMHSSIARATPAVSSGSLPVDRTTLLLDTLRRKGEAGFISFSYDDLQVIASLPASDLAAALDRTADEASRFQELCHEQALERQAAMEAVELLKMYKAAKESPHRVHLPSDVAPRSALLDTRFAGP